MIILPLQKPTAELVWFLHFFAFEYALQLKVIQEKISDF